jgi:enamine deaminase RidA (YjgF/YER057c/UK114 family)
MKAPQSPPFPLTDVDRWTLWEMLVRRDSRAFIDRNWAAIEDDFIREGFHGLDAGKHEDPAHWRLAFPSLDTYREEWLRQAEECHQLLIPDTAYEALLAATTLDEIEVRADCALARKKFHGALPKSDGSALELKWQTLYVCRRSAGRWRIASFVGYLPYAADDRAPGIRAHFPAAHAQHRTAGPYTPVVGVQAGARIFVLSGQAPLDCEGRIVGETIEEQARATLENCRSQLNAAGCELADVFKVSVYLTDLANWSRFNAVYREFFTEPYPARTAVQTGLLGFLVEVDMWAARR